MYGVNQQVLKQLAWRGTLELRHQASNDIAVGPGVSSSAASTAGIRTLDQNVVTSLLSQPFFNYKLRVFWVCNNDKTIIFIASLSCEWMVQLKVQWKNLGIIPA